MTQIQLQANDWLVFIEGVQVPFIGGSYSFGANQVAAGSLRLEPDSMLSSIRPHAVVTLFFKDRYPDVEADEIEDQYIYYGGGEISSISIDKQPHAKGVQISFSNELSILDQHKAFAMGVGGSYTSIIAAGTLLVNPFSQGGTNDLFSIRLLNLVPPEKGGLSDAAYRYVNNMIGALAWFSGHNASLRNRIIQHRLQHKFAGLDTLILKRLMERAVGGRLVDSVQELLRDDDSVLGIIQKLNGIPDYSFVSVAAPPFFPSDQVTKIYPLNTESGTKPLTKTWSRNDTLFLPNMHYAPPPPCNFVFPEMIERYAFSREFRSEPTRTIFEDNITEASTSAGRVMFVETDLIPGIGVIKDPIQFWGAARVAFGTDKTVTPSNDASSPYADARIDETKQVTEYNLLDSVADSEFQKGVVTQRLSRTDEYLSALLAVGITDSDAAQKYLKPALSQEGSETANSYTKFVQGWVRYRHGLAKFARPADVTIKGHRWLVPGFTAAIFDQDTSFTCLVNSVSHTFDPSGVENTVVSISHARPIAGIPPSLVASAAKLTNDISELKKTLNSEIKSAYAENVSVISAMLATVVAAEANIPEAEAPPLSVSEAALIGMSAGETRVIAGSKEVAAWAVLLNAVAGLVSVSQEVAGKVIGPHREVAGALTAQRFPALAQEWLNFTDNPAADLSKEDPTTLRSRLVSYATRLAALIKETLAAQEQQALNAEPWFATSTAVVSRVSQELIANGVKLADSELALRTLLNTLENGYNIPSPPDFYPEELVDIHLLDLKYQELLGCKPFYSTMVPARLIGPLEANALGSGVTTHQAMVTCLSKIFTGLANASMSPTAVSASPFPSWDSVIATSESSIEWAHRSFLKRKHQTLRQYLTTHGFKADLDRFISSEPAPTVFRVMRPQPAATVQKMTLLDYVFDDSCLSRLVDEWAIYGNTQAPDPMVAARRKKVEDPSLTSAFRQEQIIHYSRRHTGSRAYRGD